MKNNSLYYYLSGAAVLLIGATLFFLSDVPSTDPAETAATVSAVNPTTASKPTAAAKSEGKSEDWPYDVPRPNREAAAEKYSSNPKRTKEEKEVILLSRRLDMTDLEKAKALLGQVNSLTGMARIMALDYGTQLLPDENYVEMRPLLFSFSNADPDLRETVISDVLNRGDGVRMPTLVELLRQPPNEAQQEIKEILLAFLDKEPDTQLEVAQYESAVKQFLVEHPE